MAANLARQGQKLANRVLLFQSATVMALCFITLLLFDLSTSAAVLVGGLMSIVPNSVFAAFAFRFSGASKSQLVMQSFSQGAKLKLILTVILGIVAFKGLQMAPLPLFAGFIVITISQWVAMVSVQTTTNDN